MIKVILSMLLGFGANMVHRSSSPLEAFGTWLTGWAISYSVILIIEYKLTKE